MPSNLKALTKIQIEAKREISETFLELFRSNWDDARKYLLEHPEAASARDSTGCTALHHAVSLGKLDIAEELVPLMSVEDLEIQSLEGCTAFYNCVNTAAVSGDREYIKLAKCMVEKNTNLLGIVPDYDKRTPLVLAHAMEKGEEVAQTLYLVDTDVNLEGDHASEIVSAGIRLRRFDVAWNLLQTYPEIAFTKNMSNDYPFVELAGLRSPITLREQQLRFWERWIYSCIEIKPSHADYINVRMADNNQAGFPVKVGLLPRLVQVIKGLKLFGINRIYKIKVIHVRFFEFLQWTCEEARKGEDIKDLSIFADMRRKKVLQIGIFRAVEQGHAEFVTHMCKAIPRLLHVTNEKGMTMLQFAAECRQEKIYSLIYRLDEEKQRDTIAYTDKNNNNMLHVIASFSSSKQINRIRGAALQMQRELQWFKEVESIARPADLEISNLTDEMTPRELFTKSHKELAKAGEMSMKETATACTVVGALIVTMMFAAASTVPGGSNGDTGFPILLYEKMFITFMVSDAVSLFSSTTSVIMFLGILTSRYAEDDFLVSLPTRMIIGLFTLFLGIVAMMVAFSSAMFIMLHGTMSVIIPVVVLASVPVISFVWMQLPFLVEIFVSTYGGSVFDKTVERWTV